MTAPRRLAALAGGMAAAVLAFHLPLAGRSEEPTNTREKEIAAVPQIAEEAELLEEQLIEETALAA